MKRFIPNYWPLVLCFVLVLITPWLFTREYWFECFNFSETGEIGDTIGGITAPILGIVTIYFLIEALREQRGSNNKLDEQIQSEKNLRIIENRERDQNLLLNNLSKMFSHFNDDFNQLIERAKPTIDVYHNGAPWIKEEALLVLVLNYTSRAFDPTKKPDYERVIFPFVIILKRMLETFKLTIEGCLNSSSRLKMVLTDLEYFIIQGIWVPSQLAYDQIDIERFAETNGSYVGRELIFVIFSFHKLEKDLCKKINLENSRSYFGESFQKYYKYTQRLEELFLSDDYYRDKIYQIPSN